MKKLTQLEDLIGIEHCKLGFFRELQVKVAELEATNHELTSQKRLLQAVVNGIIDLIFVLSEDLDIINTNSVAEDWFSRNDLIGRKCYHLFDEKRPCPHCPAIRAIEEQRVVKEEMSANLHGQLKQYETIASPILQKGATEQFVLVSRRDVTLQKKYQMKYAQAEKMATVGTLAAGIAHEINNPLTSIAGFTQGLQRRISKLEGLVDEDLFLDFEEYTETIIAECHRCRDIVKTLLSFSRPQESSRAIVRLNQCVGDVLFILQHHLKDHHNITVQTYLDPALPPILGDESQLKQVIINLILNAFDAMTDGGEIQIITKRGDENSVILMVSDSGSGFSEDIQGKLFNPFFSTKNVGKGTGIGLSTCYSIVASHQGSITAKNNPDKGACFTVILPEVIL